VVHRARLRRASRMLITDELASDDMGSSRSPVRTAPTMPYAKWVRTACDGRRVRCSILAVLICCRSSYLQNGR
jgi:hypothetical protein